MPSSCTGFGTNTDPTPFAEPGPGFAPEAAVTATSAAATTTSTADQRRCKGPPLPSVPCRAEPNTSGARCAPALLDAARLPDHARDRPREHEEADHPVAER